MANKNTVKYAAAIRELREALGDRYVADDEVTIASYSWVTGNGNMMSDKHLYDTRPVAVTLPSTTEEVQAVVKICNKHDLKFQASSTGHSSFATVKYHNVISVDLRRMDHMEIDAENQMAIIEPYVTAQTLMAEAMKEGLTSHVVGAGWTHSPLASATSVWGIGISGNHTGTNQRNLLGWEMVTPQGEIVRGGSCASGDMWYSGDGPGPSVRGMLRGSAGALGGLGIFTKIGYKLHPWNGPAQLEHKGEHPQIGVGLTETMRTYHPVWKDWDKVTEAAYQLLKSQASTYMVRIPPDSIGHILAATNNDYVEMADSGTSPGIAQAANGHSWTLVAVSDTVAEAEWRERAIRHIVESTGGRMLEVKPEHSEVMTRTVLTSCAIPRVYRVGPRMTESSYGIYESFSHLPKVIPEAEKMMRPLKEKSKTLEKGVSEEFWIWSNEGRQVWGENIVSCDSDSKSSAAGGISYMLDTFDNNERNPRGTAAFAVAFSSDLYHRRNNADTWMYKIKQKFDPQNTADGLYPGEKRTLMGYFWPFLAKTVFRLFPSLRRKAIQYTYFK